MTRARSPSPFPAVAPRAPAPPAPPAQYFNTFGGNPVAGAVALATLDVIEREGLQAHAAAVGEVLLAGFRDLAARHACIGSVRGMGLMVGLEIVRHRDDPARRAPWTDGAGALKYAMLRRRILVSTGACALRARWRQLRHA